MTLVAAMFETLNVFESTDTKVSVSVVDTTKTPIRDVFNHFYLVNEHRFKDEGDNEPTWGKWQKSRKGKTLEFMVKVGCSCSHDCCGHLCGLRISMAMNGKWLTVIAERGYNR